MSAASDEMAARIRPIISHEPGIIEKKMFGGVGFMLNGNMAAASTAKGALMIRVAPERFDDALTRPGAGPMHMGAKQMVGFIQVTDEGLETEAALRDWIDYALAYVRTMPPK